MTERNRPLTALQQAILDFLWSHGPATGEEIRQGISAAHPLKDSSIRTLLRRLEGQGYLEHDLEGKAFLYRAAVPARGVVAGAVRQLIERFCAGSADRLILGMVDEKILTVAQMERLAKKIRSAK